MNLETFFKAFKREILEDNKTRFEKLYNGSKREYTEEMKSFLVRLVETITKEDEQVYKFYPEFFKIDYTWWEERCPLQKNNANIYDWDLLLAIEHENNCYDWTYEVAKLDQINAPLKIVIGYMKNDQRGDVEKGIIRNQVEHLRYLDTCSEFGIILMNERLDTGKADPFDVKGYRIGGRGDVEEIAVD